MTIPLARGLRSIHGESLADTAGRTLGVISVRTVSMRPSETYEPQVWKRAAGVRVTGDNRADGH